MTIKRRLFISNILMIVLPIILTAAMFFLMRSVFFSGDITDFSARRGGTGISYVNRVRGNFIAQVGDYVEVDTVISVYQSAAGDFIIILPDDLSVLNASNMRNQRILPIALIFLFGIVFLVNRALTKYISGHIMTAVNTLVDGVHEIRDGNLTCRIEYNKGDEFDAVCADFNEMATRLYNMVQERQKDENNRKELIAGISHDLKTPLTSIKGCIEGLMKGIAKTPEMQEKYLNTIQSKTENIEYIIKQLFLFSQLDIGEFPLILGAVDIGEELKSIAAGFTDEYEERGLIISLNETTQGDFVSIDKVQFRNIVQNVLDNSLKYGGREDIQTEISCKKNDGESVSIIIKDNGRGVPDDSLTKMFDVFYREDSARSNSQSGSGLGLAICSKIVERLNGSIIAENAEGGGLAIIITLPIAEESKGVR